MTRRPSGWKMMAMTCARGHGSTRARFNQELTLQPLIAEVKDYPRYTVSTDGTVTGPKGPLKPVMHRGYQRVWLYNKKGKKKFRVNVLVCTAFHGPRPPGKEASHKNGKRTDNRADNLCWKTHQENMDDKELHGTNARGDDHPSTKVPDDHLPLIKQKRIDGKSYAQIGREHGISKAHVHRICNGGSRIGKPARKARLVGCGVASNSNRVPRP